MGFIDLHVHSNASDGTLTPTQVVEYALLKGLDAIALTDHDTVDGLEEAVLAAQGTSLELIPGIEMSCIYEGTEIHLLGLYIDRFSQALADGLLRIRSIRDLRNEEMLVQFQKDGFPLTWEDLRDGNPNAVITRAHFARALTARGCTKNIKQAFDRYLRYGGRYCCRREITTPEQVLSILTAAGAFPVIAHPIQYHMGYSRLDEMILRLKPLGLKGIEVYHSSHSQYESGKLKEMAKRHQLLPTGGSDFHGSNKPDIDIGTGRGGLRLSHLLLKPIKEAQNGRII